MIIWNGIVRTAEIKIIILWNKGRTQEIKERVLHIDNKDDE